MNFLVESRNETTSLLFVFLRGQYVTTISAWVLVSLSLTLHTYLVRENFDLLYAHMEAVSSAILSISWVHMIELCMQADLD